MKFQSVVIGTFLCLAFVLPVAEGGQEKSKPVNSAGGVGGPASAKSDSITDVAKSSPRPEESSTGSAQRSPEAPSAWPLTNPTESAKGTTAAEPKDSPKAPSVWPGKTSAGSSEGAPAAEPNHAQGETVTAPPLEVIKDAPVAESDDSDADVPQAANFQSEIIHSDPEIHEQERTAADGGEEIGGTRENGEGPPEQVSEDAPPQDIKDKDVAGKSSGGDGAETTQSVEAAPKNGAAATDVNGSAGAAPIRSPLRPDQGPLFDLTID